MFTTVASLSRYMALDVNDVLLASYKFTTVASLAYSLFLTRLQKEHLLFCCNSTVSRGKDCQAAYQKWQLLFLFIMCSLCPTYHQQKVVFRYLTGIFPLTTRVCLWGGVHASYIYHLSFVLKDFMRPTYYLSFIGNNFVCPTYTIVVLLAKTTVE